MRHWRCCYVTLKSFKCVTKEYGCSHHEPTPRAWYVDLVAFVTCFYAVSIVFCLACMRFGKYLQMEVEWAGEGAKRKRREASAGQLKLTNVRGCIQDTPKQQTGVRALLPNGEKRQASAAKYVRVNSRDKNQATQSPRVTSGRTFVKLRFSS